VKGRNRRYRISVDGYFKGQQSNTDWERVTIVNENERGTGKESRTRWSKEKSVRLNWLEKVEGLVSLK